MPAGFQLLGLLQFALDAPVHSRLTAAEADEAHPLPATAARTTRKIIFVGVRKPWGRGVKIGRIINQFTAEFASRAEILHKAERFLRPPGLGGTEGEPTARSIHPQLAQLIS